MASPERHSTTENLTGLTKKLDIGGIIIGLAIGGEFGTSLALFSGVTYILAEAIERQTKK